MIDYEKEVRNICPNITVITFLNSVALYHKDIEITNLYWLSEDLNKMWKEAYEFYENIIMDKLSE
jgi:hypothetical protein